MRDHSFFEEAQLLPPDVSVDQEDRPSDAGLGQDILSTTWQGDHLPSQAVPLIDESLIALRIPLDESNKSCNDQLKIGIDKLARMVNEKEKRINELLQFEYSCKRVNEQKFLLEELLETKERSNESLKMECMQLRDTLEKQLAAHNSLKACNEELQNLDCATKEHIAELHNELYCLKTEYQKLQQQNDLQKSEKEILDLEILTATSQHQEAQEELLRLYEQLAQLKKRYKEHQDALAHAQELQNAHEHSIEEWGRERKKLIEVLSLKDEVLQNYQHEFSSIKQQLALGHRQAKEIESRYYGVMNEKIAVVTKYQQLKAEIESYHNECMQAKDALKAAIEREFTLKGLHSDQQQQWQDQLCSLQDAISCKEAEKLNLQAELENIRHQLSIALEQHASEKNHRHAVEETLCQLNEQLSEQQLEQLELSEQLAQCRQQLACELETLTAFRTNYNEQSIQLDEAKQHLAKKVRSTAELQEIIDQQQEEIASLREVCEVAQERARILEENLSQQDDSKVSLEANIDDLHREIDRLEQHALQLNEQLQDAECKVREYDLLENRHQQFKSVLASLDSVLGVPFSSSAIAPLSSPQEFTLSTHPSEELSEEEFTAPKSPYQNLFELPKSKEQLKGNLFD